MCLQLLALKSSVFSYHRYRSKVLFPFVCAQLLRKENSCSHDSLPPALDSVVAATQYLCIEFVLLTTLLVAATELKPTGCILELVY